MQSVRWTFLLIPALLSGCASYYTHYAMFPAENSQGDVRQVRVSWDTAEYPGWWVQQDQATSMKVETQCSERVWRLRDASQENAGACGDGIRACGEPGQDRRVVQVPAMAPGACLAVNPADPAARVATVGDSFELVVACKPVKPVVGQGDDAVNMSYPRASAVPYTVYARKAPRGSLRARPPAFDEHVCEQK